mmetsp:Transcript_26698/g.40725  ORF Transcript_26698/g.40725 Transcript_26698/m.40725 type:complete len:186 (+) Transcript_26698:512-1069(+)
MGYDVWVGNNRGNMYSRKNKHINPDTDPADFFAFSFQQMGLYDFPAQVDMIKKKTGVKKVTYMGHSQGTTQMFYMLCASQPEVVKRVNLFIALNPVAYMNHVQVPFLKQLADLTDNIYNSLVSSGYFEFFGPGWDEFSTSVCNHWYTKPLCDGLTAFKYSAYKNKFNYADRLKLSSVNKVNGISI